MTDVTISGDGTLTLGGTGTDSSLTLGNGSSLTAFCWTSGKVPRSTAAGSVSGLRLTGEGALKLSGAEMTVDSSASHTFTGTLDGASERSTSNPATADRADHRVRAMPATT
ncbi:MAG: hypothetical protein ACLT8E_09170 [Akkermansia sp.]